MCVLRLSELPGPTAAGWRWELAQLELGHLGLWPQSGAIDWARCAARLSRQLRDSRGPVVCAFEGYTLVGAVWPRADRPVLPRGPFVMPQFGGGTLERRLLAAWLRSCARDAAPAPLPLVHGAVA
jgi:hypothetical protein